MRETQHRRDFPAHMRTLVEDAPPRDRVGASVDIAEAMAFRSSDAVRNISGHTLVADGGVSISRVSPATETPLENYYVERQ